MSSISHNSESRGSYLKGTYLSAKKAGGNPWIGTEKGLPVHGKRFGVIFTPGTEVFRNELLTSMDPGRRDFSNPSSLKEKYLDRSHLILGMETTPMLRQSLTDFPDYTSALYIAKQTGSYILVMMGMGIGPRKSGLLSVDTTSYRYEVTGDEVNNRGVVNVVLELPDLEESQREDVSLYFPKEVSEKDAREFVNGGLLNQHSRLNSRQYGWVEV